MKAGRYSCAPPRILGKTGYRTALRRRAVVVGHQLARPRRLADVATWAELLHPRLDVEHGRSIDRIKTLDHERPSLDGDESAATHPKPVLDTDPAHAAVGST